METYFLSRVQAGPRLQPCPAPRNRVDRHPHSRFMLRLCAGMYGSGRTLGQCWRSDISNTLTPARNKAGRRNEPGSVRLPKWVKNAHVQVLTYVPCSTPVEPQASVSHRDVQK